jgi:hypothetical protein
MYCCVLAACRSKKEEQMRGVNRGRDDAVVVILIDDGMRDVEMMYVMSIYRIRRGSDPPDPSPASSGARVTVQGFVGIESYGTI